MRRLITVDLTRLPGHIWSRYAHVGTRHRPTGRPSNMANGSFHDGPIFFFLRGASRLGLARHGSGRASVAIVDLVAHRSSSLTFE